ncbi:MAG: hypothetical protein ACRDZM_18490 [Acidimicrobiia bacterium]
MKGAAAGALIAYLLDPALGRSRRAVLSHRVLTFSRAMIAARHERQLAVAAGTHQMSPTAAEARRRFLRRRRARTSRLLGWEHPMTTVHIDVDDRAAMPGLETATTRSMRAPHRGFTRSRGVYWKIGETGALPPR